MEKATRHSQHHVLGLYYDQDTKLIMVGHLVSLSLTTVNTESIYDELVKLFNYFTKASLVQINVHFNGIVQYDV